MTSIGTLPPSRATPLSDSLEQEFRVVDDRVEHYVSRFLLRSHQGPDAERQLTQIVQAEIRDLLRRTLDAESDKESEVARYKELLTDARRALVDAKQEGDLRWQQCAADAEERQRAAIEARDADADSNLVRVQADLERQLKAARDDMEARVALKDAAGARSRETHEAELGKVRAELGAERRAHLELMRAMKASDESHRKERDESATRAQKQQSRDAADAEERQRAAIEARDAEAEANLARVQADLERQLKATREDMEACIALKEAAGTRSRETHEAELGKVRAELGAERRAHLELMRAMKASDESHRKERDESATRAHEQQSRDAADAEERKRAAIEVRDADAESNLARVQADLERQLKAARDDMETCVALKDTACARSRETHEAELGKVRAELGAERHAHLELMRAMQADDESRRKEHDESATRARIQQSHDAANAAVQRRRVQEQVAQVVASWEAEQRQREGAIQQRFFAQLQADSAEMLKQKEVEVLPAAHMAVTCSC